MKRKDDELTNDEAKLYKTLKDLGKASTYKKDIKDYKDVDKVLLGLQSKIKPPEYVDLCANGIVRLRDWKYPAPIDELVLLSAFSEKPNEPQNTPVE